MSSKVNAPIQSSEHVQVQPRSSTHHDPPPTLPPSVPEPARTFFASVSSPTQILSSKLVSKVEGTDIIEGGYNFVHFLNLDLGQSHPPFPFVLRFPINPDSISRSQTRTAVGCMLYCQRYPDLNIPTPAVYAYNCTYGSEFIAMEYVDGDTLSSVWFDLSEEEKEDMIKQVVEIMRSMRTKTSFRTIGGINPDGSPCPLVDGMDAWGGRGIVDGLGLYSTGPYQSVREYIQVTVFDREFHYLDQVLHKGTLSAHEAVFKEDMSNYAPNLTPEEVFERVKKKRDDFIAHPYECEYPFVLRHGDLHGRNVIVSRSSPRRILTILDWDFGGSQALPFADHNFEVSSPDSDQDMDEIDKQGEELDRFQDLINSSVGEPPYDRELMKLVGSTRLYVLDSEAKAAAGGGAASSAC